MPGETVFLDLSKTCSDIRFTSKDFEKKYQAIIDEVRDANTHNVNINLFQNKKWYNIYSEHRSEKMILISNREFLLCRDMYIITIVSLIIYCVFSLLLRHEGLFLIEYLVYLISMSVITNLSSRQKAKRLVYNVIAVDLQNHPEGGRI